MVADHIRSCAFLIVVDGSCSHPMKAAAMCLRRIIRRALRHGHNLGAKVAVSFSQAGGGSSGEVMGEAYPELLQQSAARDYCHRSKKKKSNLPAP